MRMKRKTIRPQPLLVLAPLAGLVWLLRRWTRG